MQTTAPTSLEPRRRRRLGFGWFVLSCVAIAVMAPMPYLTASLSSLAESDAGLARHYAAQPATIRWALVAHAAFAGAALLLTPLQASVRLRANRPRLHRVTGRVLLALILPGAATGLVIAQVSYAGTIGRLGFSALAVVWAGSALAAVHHARHRRLDLHRRWAVRAMALTYAAVTLRLWMILFVVVQRPSGEVAAQDAFDRAYPIVPFLCWVPNLIVAEWLLRRSEHGDGSRVLDDAMVHPTFTQPTLT